MNKIKTEKEFEFPVEEHNAGRWIPACKELPDHNFYPVCLKYFINGIPTYVSVINISNLERYGREELYWLKTPEMQ